MVCDAPFRTSGGSATCAHRAGQQDFHTSPLITGANANSSPLISPGLTAAADRERSESPPSELKHQLTNEGSSVANKPWAHDTDANDDDYGSREASKFDAIRNLGASLPSDVERVGVEELPTLSIKSGDWRAYTHVQARVVVWGHRGVVVQGGLARKREDEGIKEEFAIDDGALWISSKTNQVVFVPLASSPPEATAISSPFLLKSSRRISLTLNRTISRDRGSGLPPPHSDDEGGVPSSSSSGGGKASFADSFMKIFKRKKAGSDNGDAVDGRLSRSRTRETPPSRRSLSTARVLECPLPTFRNAPVTALSFPPSAIHSLRFSAPVADADAAALKLDQPGRVEIDVASSSATMASSSCDAGAKRDVTIAFCFAEPLLADEAATFRDRVDELRRGHFAT